MDQKEKEEDVPEKEEVEEVPENDEDEDVEDKWDDSGTIRRIQRQTSTCVLWRVGSEV